MDNDSKKFTIFLNSGQSFKVYADEIAIDEEKGDIVFMYPQNNATIEYLKFPDISAIIREDVKLV